MPAERNRTNAPTPGDGFDVFLSYNWRDWEAVRAVADYLRRLGLRPFLDRWYPTPGQPWIPGLERALAACHAVAVFVGPHGFGPWQQREAYAALDRQSHTAGFPLIPVLLPGADPALGFLGQSTWVDLRSGVKDDFELRLLEAGIRGEPPGPELEERLQSTRAAVCPYRGLLYFREEDAPFFFGREAAVAQLVEAVGRHSLLAVVGASGSGKSSVVRAGLVPALRRARDIVWEVVTLAPGEQPLKALSDALTPLLFPELDAIDRSEKSNKLAARFAEGSVPLRDMVKEALARQTGTQRLLLVADQWEELYTLTKDDAARRRFLDELLDALEHSPLTVVLTLRGDFVGKALAYRPLSDRLQGAQVNLGPMTREELHRAIEQPAYRVGVSFEAGLVERVLDDVGDEPGNLPLLEFVLKQLWDTRRGTLLYNHAYEEMGKLQGAIAQRAEKFFASLSVAEQEALRRLFLYLVHATGEGQETRRREKLSNLTEAARPLIARLSGADIRNQTHEPERLLVTTQGSGPDEQFVEIAHEALVRSWGRLAAWLKADLEFLLWRQRLRAAREAWDLSRRNEETLLRGPLLDEAERWFILRVSDLSGTEREFIGASLEGRLKRREQEQRQQVRLRRVAVTAFVSAVLAVIAGVLATTMWGQAEKNRREALAQVAGVNWELAQRARGAPFAATAPSLIKAVPYLLKAADAGESAGQMGNASNAKFSAYLAARPLLRTLLHSGSVLGVTNSPDSLKLLSWSEDGTARLWRTDDGQPLGAPMNHKAPVYGAVFSADRQRILSWSEDGMTLLWRAQDGQPVGAPMKQGDVVFGAVFSADGQRILSSSLDGTARLWSAGNSQLIAVFLHEAPTFSACFDKEERGILTAREDDTLGLWDISFDATIPTQERIVEFEVRSATTLEANGEVRVLTEAEWAAKKQQLAGMRRKRGVR